MKLQRFALAVSFSIFFLTTTAIAWNDLGHRVVAQIAWNQLDQATKTAVIKALKTAPSDSGMLWFMPANKNNWPSNVDDPLYAKLFQHVATWPDLVRKVHGHPKPTDKYHNSDWHFVNIFWRGSDNSLTNDPKFGSMLIKLTEFSGTHSSENAAVQIAWLVHMTGDAHQPLHCSARITSDSVEQDGDRGGNEFCLEPGCREDTSQLNLHSYWDSSLNRNNFKNPPNETMESWAWRIAKSITDEHPKSEFQDTSGFSSSSHWSEEGVQRAISDAYPTSLVRDQMPSTNYRKRVYRIARERIALAGYRLAATLKAKFGT